LINGKILREIKFKISIGSYNPGIMLNKNLLPAIHDKTNKNN
tara:strand:+ start:242 stop:367 length:126 start_codon:yes stop_codon:yes gene_type:complete